MQPYDLTQLSMMIVDDNLMIRRLVEKLLNCIGVGSVIRAGNGDDALHILGSTHIDMVITDCMMEPMDGFELVRNLRTAEQSPNRLVPILMMTAHTETWRVAAARDAGINEFIVKPITGDALLSRIIYMIEHPRVFVRTRTYFGPDRRRKSDVPYHGPERRSAGRAKGDTFMSAPVLGSAPTPTRDNDRQQHPEFGTDKTMRMPA